MMKYKCWCIFFVSLLVFACNNSNNSNNNGNFDDSSSSEASEPIIDLSSSSALAGDLLSSSSGTTSPNNSSSSSNSNNVTASSSSVNSPSSSSGVSSNGGTASSSSVSTSSSGNSSNPSSSSNSSNPSSSSNSSNPSSSSNSSSSSIATVSSSSVGTANTSSASNGGNLSYGTRFTPEMLGLTPGATTANLNLNWISTSANCSSSSTDDGKTLVRLFNASGSLVNTFTGTTAKGPSGKCVHKATITGITPATSYKYSVSNNDKDWSNDYNYKSPPSGNVFTFAVIADPQITDGAQDSNTKPKASPSTTAQGWADVVKKIAETDATFIVSAGDQVDSYTYSPSQYTKFFAPEGLRSLPFAPVPKFWEL